MSEVTVRPGRPGFCVVVSYPGGEQPLALAPPDDTHARIDLICLGDSEVMAVFGTPMPPPLQVPECPDGAEVLAGVLVRPLYVASSDIINVASSDIIKPEKLKAASDPA
jgi:hypothetical protein